MFISTRPVDPSEVGSGELLEDNFRPDAVEIFFLPSLQSTFLSPFSSSTSHVKAVRINRIQTATNPES